jgi:hypothetical protein
MVVDVVSGALVQLAELVVRQFGEMHDRIEPFNVLRGNPAHVLRDGQRPRVIVVIEPAVAIKTAIDADNIDPRSTSRGPRTAPIYPAAPVINTRIALISPLQKTKHRLTAVRLISE